jgi:hypothetical protein
MTTLVVLWLYFAHPWTWGPIPDAWLGQRGSFRSGDMR